MTKSQNPTPLKVAILGAAGRMGQALIRSIGQVPGLRLYSALESDQCPLLGRDAGQVAGQAETGILLTADCRKAMAGADVLIDFSLPSASVKHAALAGELKKPLVLGTTGLKPEEDAIVNKAAQHVPIVWAPNMSLGVNLLFAMVSRAAAILRDYNLEIIETHHRHKQDAPSGTALRLAELAAAARNQSLEKLAVHGRQGLPGPRSAEEIGIHAVRAGDVVGDHTVMFATDGERLELCHRASSRDCFALGALRAAVWVAGRQPGLYSMLDVLELAG